MASLVLKNIKNQYLMNQLFLTWKTYHAQLGTKNILEEQGADGVVEWIKEQKEVLVTDTTFRDAHQSLLATRIRSNDILNIAEPTSKLLPNLFSMEMWGGATFDVAYRFLNKIMVRLKNKDNVFFFFTLRLSWYLLCHCSVIGVAAIVNPPTTATSANPPGGCNGHHPTTCQRRINRRSANS